MLPLFSQHAMSLMDWGNYFVYVVLPSTCCFGFVQCWITFVSPISMFIRSITQFPWFFYAGLFPPRVIIDNHLNTYRLNKDLYRRTSAGQNVQLRIILGLRFNLKLFKVDDRFSFLRLSSSGHRHKFPCHIRIRDSPFQIS